MSYQCRQGQANFQKPEFIFPGAGRETFRLRYLWPPLLNLRESGVRKRLK
jgi:hypothetical protein